MFFCKITELSCHPEFDCLIPAKRERFRLRIEKRRGIAF